MQGNRFMASAGVFGLMLFLAGCGHEQTKRNRGTVPTPSSSTTNVSYRMAVPAKDAKYYELKVLQSDSLPAVAENPAPVYPAWLIGKHLPAVELTAQLAVNGSGKVYNVIVPGEAQADPDRRAFIAAVRKAALGWTFIPYAIKNWRERADGSRELVSVEHPPFSQFFVFRFELRDGKPWTSTGAASSAGGR